MRVPMRGTGAERPVVAKKSGKPDGAKGSRHPACPDGQPRKREEPLRPAKLFCISQLDDGSRMSGDVHVRFCERLGVKVPRATHLEYLLLAHRPMSLPLP